MILYNVFQRFRQTEFVHAGLILSSSHFLLLAKQHIKMTFTIKVVKIDSKNHLAIIIYIGETYCRIMQGRIKTNKAYLKKGSHLFSQASFSYVNCHSVIKFKSFIEFVFLCSKY
jgi:hypothetical protein